jgi:uncharacterized protein YjbI with pentapeptide repeats
MCFVYYAVYTQQENEMIKILNVRGELLLELDAKHLRDANLRDANLRDADLRCADLSGVDLRGANLLRANLRGADLRDANMIGADLSGANLFGDPLRKNPLTLCGLRYWCLISDNHMRLGCKCFTHAEWEGFTDEEISKMDNWALEFWNEHKSMLIEMCKAHK